ncbi:protein MAIN-LIKE 2-like [Nicotiana tomentosiformis]|uniref:protein MAIN-LIKE 2-like n=1 Tax=Nicotiana tomentosiformis TaxID=4098 RepID=UPI00388C8684
MGFYWIIEIDRLQFDWPLITAMIEQWRLKTHTFYLPIGEATITLQDVEVLFGFPVDEWLSATRKLLGIIRERNTYICCRGSQVSSLRSTAMNGASRLQLSPVRQHMVVLHAEITDDLSVKAIERQMRLLLFMVFGGIIFPNTWGNLVSLQSLHHMEQLDELPTYS